jgi:hypothetical protein
MIHKIGPKTVCKLALYALHRRKSISKEMKELQQNTNEHNRRKC